MRNPDVRQDLRFATIVNPDCGRGLRVPPMRNAETADSGRSMVRRRTRPRACAWGSENGRPGIRDKGGFRVDRVIL